MLCSAELNVIGCSAGVRELQIGAAEAILSCRPRREEWARSEENGLSLPPLLLQLVAISDFQNIDDYEAVVD